MRGTLTTRAHRRRPQSANRYAYGLGNPLAYSDPSGHVVRFIANNPGLVVEFAAGFVYGKATGLYMMAVGALGYDPLTGQTLSPTDFVGDVADPGCIDFVSFLRKHRRGSEGHFQMITGVIIDDTTGELSQRSIRYDDHPLPAAAS